MEVKTLLRLIKDDISLLEGITSEFNMESLPTSDEIEVALVRANALLKELDLLHKFTDHHESGSKPGGSVKEPVAAFPEPVNSEQKPFELFVSGSGENEQAKQSVPEQPDRISAVEVKIADLYISERQPGEELQEISTNPPRTTAYFTPRAEPAGLVDAHGESPVVTQEEAEESLTVLDDSRDVTQHKLLESDKVAAVNQEVTNTETTASIEAVIVPDIQDHKEEIVAEDFKEVKKTLNETLGESHQMVNDILAPERSESGYKLIPIDSIWDGIGINDRFLYIRELFANNSARFESTVAALDELASIQDAVNYLKSNFKWNKTATSQKFLVLVKRRFTK